MCARESSPFEVSASPADTHASVGVPAAAAVSPGRGSRRRRLWEFDGHAHCPVIGVCLPIAHLRRLVGKVWRVQSVAGDYDLHCGAIAECKQRSALAQAVQGELDRRFVAALRQSAKAKTTEALSAWWGETSRGDDLAGAFWATLTHPRCAPELERQVLGE
ncbi:MAG: hypothetical protein Q8K93_32580, partial [Reyranella sp.]|nr:hypothetical protein [Reyranella sp.]